MEGKQLGETVEDMITMDSLTEEALLRNIEARYKKDHIYTYVGTILLAVNPYQILPELFSPEIVERYASIPVTELSKNSPHVFATASRAFHYLRDHNKSQSVLISGESGAGKTESTKLMLQYLASMSGIQSDIEQKIVETSPLLESFGNAKTVRNNNSSRFGKFIEVHFDSNGNHIIGARIVQYLLEKSRVVYQAPNERNYSVFYQLCAGASEEERAEFGINSADDFNYLSQGKASVIDGVDDTEEFMNLLSAFSCLEIPEKVQKTIFKMLSAIMHLGNVNFSSPKNSENSEVSNADSSKIAIIARLLEVDGNRLINTLTKRNIRAKEVVAMNLKVAQAYDARDTFAKSLYYKIFQWLINAINGSLAKQLSQKFIGFLDIFGFENFDVNRFEQLCVNYCNEKLQQHFNQHIFKIEQEEYSKEKITWSSIDFIDNQPCLNLIEEKHVGLLSVIEEECRFPKATDDTMLKKFITNHAKHSNFSTPKTATSTFIIQHYAGKVSYDVTGFLEKSRTAVEADIVELLNSSKNPIIATLFNDEKNEDNDMLSPKGMSTLRKGAVRVASLGLQFKSQLDELVSILSYTEPHYVRCIKPNHVKASANFDKNLVNEQLRYLGMMETVKIRKMGFAMRYPFAEFWDRYKIIAKNPAALVDKDKKKAFERLFQQVQPLLAPNTFQVGLTKLFMKTEAYNQVEVARTKALVQKVIIIQKTWRMAVTKKYYKNVRERTVKAQAVVRRWIQRRQYLKLYNAAVAFQTVWKMRKAIRLAKKLRLALVVQAYFRALNVRKDFVPKVLAKRKQEAEEKRKKEEEERKRLEAMEKDKRLKEEQRLKEEAEKKRKEEAERKRIQEEELKKLEQQELAKQQQLKKAEDDKRKVEDDKRKVQDAESKRLQQIKEEEEQLQADIRKAQEELERLAVDSLAKKDSKSQIIIPKSTSGSQIMKPADSKITRGTSGTGSGAFLVTKDATMSGSPQRANAIFGDQGSNQNSPASSRTNSSADLQNGTRKFTLGGTMRLTMRGTMKLNVNQTISKVPSGLATLTGTKKGTLGSNLSGFSTIIKAAAMAPEKYATLVTPIFLNFSKRNLIEELTSGSAVAAPVAPPLISSPFEVAEFPFSAFAKKNFQLQMTGKLKRRVVESSELMLFSKKKMSHSLLKMGSDETKLAHEIWDSILSYMGLSKDKQLPKEQNILYAESIINTGLANAVLRNEIYCQLVRQTINNNTPSLTQAWELLAMVCSCFPPNHFLLKYIAALLYQIANNKSSDFSQFADYALGLLSDTAFFGARTLVPSTDELKAISQRQLLPINICFMDGYVLTMEVKPSTKVFQVFQEAVNTVQLQSSQGFALYEVSGELERTLARDEYIGDIFAKWDQFKKVNKVKGITVDFEIHFKKQLYLPREGGQVIDESEYDLLFQQTALNVVRSYWSCDEKQAIQLALFKYQYDTSIPVVKALKELPPEALEQYLPRKFYTKKKPEEWHKLISAQATTIAEGRTKAQIARSYMEIAKALPFYGSTIYSVQHKSNWKLPASFDLVISFSNVKFVTSDTREVLKSYTYDDLAKWSYTTTTFLLVLIDPETKEAGEITLQTIQGIQIFEILTLYAIEIGKVSKWARATRPNTLTMEEVDLPEEEKRTYSILSFQEGDVIKIEQRLNSYIFVGSCKGKTGLLARSFIRLLQEEPNASKTSTPVIQIPMDQPKEEDRKFATESFLTPSQMFADDEEFPLHKIWNNKFRAVGKKGNVEVKFFFENRMVYESTPIFCSILTMRNEELNKAAVDFFEKLGKFLDHPPPKFFGVIQELCEAGVKNPELKDEIYMQMIKQTRNNPKFSSRLKAWQLFACIAGNFAPTEPYVPYVLAYMKEMTKNDDTQLANIALLAMRRLNKLRKFKVERIAALPQREIEAVMSGAINMEVTMATLEGKNFSVSVDHVLSNDQVILRAMKVLNLKRDGYHLFEWKDFNTLIELKGSNNFCDTLKLLEEVHETGVPLSQYLIFRKALNMELRDLSFEDSELGLLWGECLHLVMTGKVVISQDLATNLAALNLQITHGDFNPKTLTLDEKKITEFVPKYILEAYNLGGAQIKIWCQTVQLCWVNLSGTNVSEARRTYIQLLRDSVPLFGATSFVVGTSMFSSELRKQLTKPKPAVMVLDFDGIYFINQSSKFEDIQPLFTRDKNNNWIYKSAGGKNEPVKLLTWKTIVTWRGDAETLTISHGSLVKSQKMILNAKYARTIQVAMDQLIQILKERFQVDGKGNNNTNSASEGNKQRKSVIIEAPIEERIKEDNIKRSELAKRRSGRVVSFVDKKFNFEDVAKQMMDEDN